MTHFRAARMLDRHRHGIPLCGTPQVALALLVEALELLEADRRLLASFHVHPDAAHAPRVEADA